MASVDADRNLLLGILAQQMDFVSRDALFAAMNAWIIRKETPLGVLLVERGDLAHSRRVLLEALVDEHVRAHGGEPARSLQALSSVGPVAEDLGRLADPDLQASVGYLRTRYGSVAAPGDSMATRAPSSQGAWTSWNGRFRVVRPHASGGLGVVSVALDDELDREVAFKEIKDRYADDESHRARFVIEAEITGKLEHPGIIPIYGLGHDPAGRPFYAMRFIRGDSLADAINRYHDPAGPYLDPTKRSLQLRELLGRFLDVCDAVAYAHSRGVLHRDLKPGNVMLGPFGETLVVDWGLALPLDRVLEGHDSTQSPVKPTKADSASLPREHGQAVGTPAYMPPEQAEGAIDKLGPRSDVYGLGAILYDLLTGKHPIEGKTLEEILHRVGCGEILSPRQVRPEVSASLEAVCLKALALRPEDRYATPRALAVDIKAWLADEPVSARREPFAERARRWAKRNRTAVTSAAASLLVGFVGLGAIATVLTTSNIALDKQRRRAEDREVQAIAAVKRFGDVITNEPALKSSPALAPLRKRLLAEPLAFFRALRDRLQADRDTRPESLDRLANASFALGRLTSEIGNKRDALIAYREALAIYQTLAQANPSVNRCQSDLAASHNNLGNLLSATGQPAEALKAHNSAMTILQTLAQANPTVTQYQSDLAVGHYNIALLLRVTGKPAEALKASESALAIQQTLARANPTATEYQSAMGTTLFHIGLLMSGTGQPAAALKAHESAREIRQTLAKASPEVNEYQSDLASSYNSIGILLRGAGDMGEALKAFQSALAIERALVQANPAVTQYQSDLAVSQNSLGNFLSVTGHPAEALKAHELALDIQQTVARGNPAVTQYQTELARSHNSIGLLLNDSGRPAEALKAYESALAIQQPLTREHPESPEFASALGATLHNMGLVDFDLKQFERARGRFREAIAWQRKAHASNPANSGYRQSLLTHLTALIEAGRAMGDSDGMTEAERDLASLRDSDPAMVALDARLVGVVRGTHQPTDMRERLELAQRAYDKALHALAAKLWGEALDADPRLGEDRQSGHRYNAACSAALAGCGQGKDVPTPDGAAKVKLRDQARAWLGAEVMDWSKVVDSGSAEGRPLVVQTLERWREDSDLAGIRESKPLAALPEAEQVAWRALWADFENLLSRARARPTADLVR